MSIPAGERRRSRIRWHDEGPSPRARNVIFDDASPYKALALAMVLGVFSVAAVVGVIQFQRQGVWSDVGASIVEQARATPNVQEAAALAKPEAVEPAASATAVKSAATANDAGPDGDAVRTASNQPQATVDAARAMVRSVSAELAMPMPAQARAQVDIAEPDETDAPAVAPLTTNNPRWLGSQTASLSPAPAAKATEASEALAFAPVESPKVAPLPQPAPRSKAVVVAAVQAKPDKVKPKAENASMRSDDADMANAKVRSSVFLRSRPADGSGILLTIPGGANVQVDSGCRHWCAVTYQGKRGFVYKSFLRR